MGDWSIVGMFRLILIRYANSDSLNMTAVGIVVEGATGSNQMTEGDVLVDGMIVTYKVTHGGNAEDGLIANYSELRAKG